MAAKALTQSRPSQSSSQPASNLQSPPPASVQATASSSSMNSSTNVPANPVKSSLPAALPSTNGHLVPAPEDDDPFVVKPGRSPATLTVSPPAIDDTESWPEVGQAAATPLNGKKEGREEDEKGHEREASQGQGLKKSTFIFPLSLPPKNIHLRFNIRIAICTYWSPSFLSLFVQQARRRNGYLYLRISSSSRDLLARSMRGKGLRTRTRAIIANPVGSLARRRHLLARGPSSRVAHILQLVDELRRRTLVLSHSLKHRVGRVVFILVLVIPAYEAAHGSWTMSVVLHPVRTGVCDRRPPTRRPPLRSPNPCQCRSSSLGCVHMSTPVFRPVRGIHRPSVLSLTLLQLS